MAGSRSHRRPLRASWPLVVCALALASTGCSHKAASLPAGTCDDSHACPAGQVCVVGVCRSLCVSSENCAPAEQCRDGYCQPGGSSCDADGDCTLATICQTTTGARCIGGECTYPSRPDGTACTTAATPPTAGTCLDGRCAECAEAADCPDWSTAFPACVSKSCQEGTCVYVPNADAVCVEAGCDRENDVLSASRLCGDDLGDLCPLNGDETACADGFGCDSTGTLCLTTCGADDDCAAGRFCNTVAACALKRPDGADCTGLAESACQSGYCDGRLCCSAGDCCNYASSDCPAFYHASSVCNVAGGVTCQGTRRDALCTDHVCGSDEVPDDSGCAGQFKECVEYEDMVCSAGTDQPVADCATTCPTPGSSTGCAPGYVCNDSNACATPPGVGAACTDTCIAGLECENSVCCAIDAQTTCCNGDEDCPDHRGCNLITYACRTTCATAGECASGTLCYQGNCVTGLPDGAPCTAPGECTSGACHTDWAGSAQFCAHDATTCVYDTGSGVAQRAAGWAECGGTDGFRQCGSGGAWSGVTACGARACNTQGSVTCGYVANSANVCVTGTSGGCSADIGSATCTDCGTYTSNSSACNSAVAGSCAKACGATCESGETALVAFHYCSGSTSYQRKNACGDTCLFTVDDGTANDEATPCASGCSPSTGLCTTCATTCTGTCMKCDAGDNCVPVDSGQQGQGCTGAATTCSGADSCDGGGHCQANDLTGQQAGCNTACHYCSGGTCTYLTAGQGYGCSAGATTCSGADTCDASGNCQANDSSYNSWCADNGDCQWLGCNAGACNVTNNRAGSYGGCAGGATACRSNNYCSGGGCTHDSLDGPQTGCGFDEAPCYNAHSCSAGSCVGGSIKTYNTLCDNQSDCHWLGCNVNGLCNVGNDRSGSYGGCSGGGNGCRSNSYCSAGSCTYDNYVVNCVGSWSGCGVAVNPSATCGDGVKTYHITTAAACGGAACEAGEGATTPCTIGTCDHCSTCDGYWQECNDATICDSTQECDDRCFAKGYWCDPHPPIGSGWSGACVNN